MFCRIFIIFIIFLAFLKAQVIEPQLKINLENNIIFMTYDSKNLLVGTDGGSVMEVGLNGSVKEIVKLDNIKNFYSDSYAPKIYGISKFDNDLLILSEGDFGSKNLNLFKDGLKIKLDIDTNGLKQVEFVGENLAFLGFSSNQIALLDLESQKIIYKKQISQAPFSSFSIDLEYFALVCESGVVYFGTWSDGKILWSKEVHKDNAYSVKLKNEFIITAGQDRMVGILSDIKKKAKLDLIEADFLVYSVGLGYEHFAFMTNENADIKLLELESKSEIATLSGHKSIINAIVFIDKNKIASSEDGKNILIWEF